MPVAAMPPEPRQPVYDVDFAEELVHGWLRAKGLTSREDLWLGTLSARARVRLAVLVRNGGDTRKVRDELRGLTREVQRRLLRHQLAQPRPPSPEPAEGCATNRERDHDERGRWEWELGQLELHPGLPASVTTPPEGWLTGEEP